MNNNKPKILHISYTDAGGGSAHAAYRIHTGLKQVGFMSRMLVGIKSRHDNDIRKICNNELWYTADRLCGKFFDKFDFQYLFYPSSFLLFRNPWVKDADIIQLYNIHSGYFSFTVLPALSKKHTIIWRLSDMWPMTGHCTHSYECERYKIGCGLCPHLEEYPSLKRDRTVLLWKIKKWTYARSSITIIAPSQWIAALVRQSPLLGDFKTYIIPNGLDTSVFRPIPKEIARCLLDIDQSKRVILFSAQNINHPRKGGFLLKEALIKLAQKKIQDVMLLVTGKGNYSFESEFNFPVKRLGFINNDLMLAAVYSAADVFVMPALAENLPNVILESMACGTPSVAFNIGGIPEVISHMELGYLARHKDVDDLVKGIELVLENNELRRTMSLHCRRVAESKFSLSLQIQHFRDLYQDLGFKMA